MALLLSVGTRYRRLNVPGEEDFIGAGIHFCATCDGPFYKGEQMVVIGGGNSALEEGLFLTRFAEKVTLLVRGDSLRASQILQEKAENQPKMELRFNTTVQEFRGERRLSGVVVKDVKATLLKRFTPALCSSSSGWTLTQASCPIWLNSTTGASSALSTTCRRA